MMTLFALFGCAQFLKFVSLLVFPTEVKGLNANVRFLRNNEDKENKYILNHRSRTV